jgi:RNA polymerase sigma-70 factor, ECF subfamily
MYSLLLCVFAECSYETHDRRSRHSHFFDEGRSRFIPVWPFFFSSQIERIFERNANTLPKNAAIPKIEWNIPRAGTVYGVCWPLKCREGVPKTVTNRQFANDLIAQLPALRRYALALVGGSALADDLVQDCIERALRRPDALNDKQRLLGWLRSILHNLYIDELRRRRSRGREEDIADLSDNLTLSVPAADRGEFRDLVTAMATLNVEHRQILLLVGLEGLNYREISNELDVPMGTVMSRLARAREKLRGAMESGARPDDHSNVEMLSTRRRSER